MLGGSQQGAFTASVLDARLKNDFDPPRFFYRRVF
jgi:predicted patatin/cPLA2 family phospholipase